MAEPIVVRGSGPNGGITNPRDVKAVTEPLVSILIPCCGMLEYTKLCVPSVLKHSRPPFELIFIDIGSLDGTGEFLAGVAMCNPSVRVEVVRTRTDLGIKDACKKALGQARGEYIALLNNDTIVTANWLNFLIGLATKSPAIGAVGPMSNYAAPPQLVEAIPYRIGPKKSAALDGRHGPAGVSVEFDMLNKFAMEFTETNRGKYVEVERLGGFCLLIKREAFKRMGPLDRWSDLGLFDTDILSAKTREAGFTLACCRDLFIHHFGTRTFAHAAPSSADRPDALRVN